MWTSFAFYRLWSRLIECHPLLKYSSKALLMLKQQAAVAQDMDRTKCCVRYEKCINRVVIIKCERMRGPEYRTLSVLA